MEAITNLLSTISGFVWGPWMAGLLLLTGLVLTVRMLFVQVRGFAHGVGIATGRYDDPAHQGELTHFQALSAALSAPIGIGNIAGVAIGIYYGGPGAIFWMWVTAFFGMAIKYTECSLAVKYRKIEPDGNVRGGPMYYIELGMHKYFKPLAWMFAFCTAVAAFGAGNMVQSNTMADSLVDALGIGRREVSVSNIVSADFHRHVAAYNDHLTNLNLQLEHRRSTHSQWKEAVRTYGETSTAAQQLKAELDALMAPLERTQKATQTEIDWLNSLTLYGLEPAAHTPEFYTSTDANRPTEPNMPTYRLEFGNEPINEETLTFVEEAPVHGVRWIIGIVIGILVAIVIIGGIKRIGNVASLLVPFMSIVYCVSALVVLVMHADTILPAFASIFYHAFNPPAVVGGSVAGATFWMTFSWGLRRGLFSNEAGQGSAAMAHSTAKVEEPVREGLVAMLGPFIDTIVICTMTALVIIATGVWDCGLNGAPLTMHAFNKALPVYGGWMVVLGVALFAFSTVLAWSYYGEKGAEYLFGRKAKLPYKWIYVVFTVLGARFNLEAVWSYADTANGLMAVPNLIALIVLSGVVVGYTKKYMDEKARGLHKPFRKK